MEEQEIMERPNLESLAEKRKAIIKELKKCNSLMEMRGTTKDFFTLALKKQKLFYDIKLDELEEYTLKLNEAFWEDVIVETEVENTCKYKDTFTLAGVTIPEEFYDMEDDRHSLIVRGLKETWKKSDLKEAIAKINEEMRTKINPVLIFFLDDLTRYSFGELIRLSYMSFSTLFLGKNTDYDGKSIIQAISLEMKRMIENSEAKDIEKFKSDLSKLVSKFVLSFKDHKKGNVDDEMKEMVRGVVRDLADKNIEEETVYQMAKEMKENFEKDWGREWDIFEEEFDEEEDIDMDFSEKSPEEICKSSRRIFLYIIENLLKNSSKKHLGNVVKASDLNCIQDLMINAEKRRGISRPWSVYSINLFTGWIDYWLYVKDGNIDNFDYSGIALKWAIYNSFSSKYGNYICGAGIRQKLNYNFWLEVEDLKNETEINYKKITKSESHNCELYEEIYLKFAKSKDFGTKRDLYNFFLNYFDFEEEDFEKKD